MTINGFVAYVKQLWKNRPDTSTPVSADRLSYIESGIKGNSDAIEKIAAAVISQLMNDPNKIASAAALYAANQNLQGQITSLNSDLSGKANASDLNNVKTSLAWGEFPGTSLTDLNIVRPNGKFAIGTYLGNATGNPAPGNSGGFMAFGVGGTVVQTAWMHSGTYARRYTGGAWGGWQKTLSF